MFIVCPFLALVCVGSCAFTHCARIICSTLLRFHAAAAARGLRAGDGQIDFNEFLSMMSQTERKDGQDELRKAFAVFDKVCKHACTGSDRK